MMSTFDNTPHHSQGHKKTPAPCNGEGLNSQYLSYDSACYPMRFSYRFFITSDNVCLLVLISEVIFPKNGLTMRIIKHYPNACISEP